MEKPGFSPSEGAILGLGWNKVAAGRMCASLCLNKTVHVKKEVSQLRFLNAPKLLPPPFVGINMTQAAR